MTSTKTEVVSVRRGSPPNPRSKPERDTGRGFRYKPLGKKTQWDLSAHYGAQYCKDIAQGTPKWFFSLDRFLV